MRIEEANDKYQSSRPISIILTEGQVQWLLDQPEYVEAKETAERTQSPLYGVLNEIINQISRQYSNQVRRR